MAKRSFKINIFIYLKSTRRLIEPTLNLSWFLSPQTHETHTSSIATLRWLRWAARNRIKCPLGHWTNSLTVVAIIYIPAYSAGQRITFVNGFRADFQANWHRNDSFAISIHAKFRHKTGISRVERPHRVTASGAAGKTCIFLSSWNT